MGPQLLLQGHLSRLIPIFCPFDIKPVPPDHVPVSGLVRSAPTQVPDTVPFLVPLVSVSSVPVSIDRLGYLFTVSESFVQGSDGGSFSRNVGLHVTLRAD